MDKKAIGEIIEKTLEIVPIGLFFLWIFACIALFVYSTRFEYIETKDQHYYVRVDKAKHTNNLLYANKSKENIGYWKFIPRYEYFTSKTNPCIFYRADRINGTLTLEPLITPKNTLCINGKIFKYTYKNNKNNDPLGLFDKSENTDEYSQVGKYKVKVIKRSF